MKVIKNVIICFIVLFVGSAIVSAIADSGKKSSTKEQSPSTKKEVRKILQAYCDINEGMDENQVKNILSKVGKPEEFNNIGDKSLGYIKDEISVKDNKEAIVVGFKDGKVSSKDYTTDITDVDGKTDFAYINYNNNGKYESGIWDRDNTKKNLAENKSENEIESMVVELYN